MNVHYIINQTLAPETRLLPSLGLTKIFSTKSEEKTYCIREL